MADRRGRARRGLRRCSATEVRAMSRLRDWLVAPVVLLARRGGRRAASRRSRGWSWPPARRTGAPELGRSRCSCSPRPLRRRRSSRLRVRRRLEDAAARPLARARVRASSRARCIVIAQARRRHRGARRALPAPRRRRRAGGGRADRRGGGRLDLARAAARGSQAARRWRRARRRARHARRVARPGARTRPAVRDAVAARAPPRRRARPPAARRRDRAGGLLHRVPGARRPRADRRAARSSSGSTRASSTCRRSAATGRRDGIVAYSKICTHAGCAVSLYRVPTFAPVEPKPALVCPCHYSTFDPATGGDVLFGPAGRPLPQLPLDDRRGGRAARGRELLRPGRPVVVGRARTEPRAVIRRVVRYVDERTAARRSSRKALRYVFPDHWSFLLGEVALYCVRPARRDRRLPDAVLRPERRARSSTTGSYAPLRGAR